MPEYFYRTHGNYANPTEGEEANENTRTENSASEASYYGLRGGMGKRWRGPRVGDRILWRNNEGNYGEIEFFDKPDPSDYASTVGSWSTSRRDNVYKPSSVHSNDSHVPNRVERELKYGGKGHYWYNAEGELPGPVETHTYGNAHGFHGLYAHEYDGGFGGGHRWKDGRGEGLDGYWEDGYGNGGVHVWEGQDGNWERHTFSNRWFEGGIYAEIPPGFDDFGRGYDPGGFADDGPYRPGGYDDFGLGYGGPGFDGFDDYGPYGPCGFDNFGYGGPGFDGPSYDDFSPYDDFGGPGFGDLGGCGGFDGYGAYDCPGYYW